MSCDSISDDGYSPSSDRLSPDSSSDDIKQNVRRRRSARLQEVRELAEKLEDSDEEEEEGNEIDCDFEPDNEGIFEGYGEDEEEVDS
ncbi:hypothetical protein ACLB2K_038135 [Fragaria x ananassa]